MKQVRSTLLLLYFFALHLSAQPNQSDSAKVEGLIQKANEQWSKSVDEAIAAVEEALPIAKSSGNLYLEARCWENLGFFQQDKWNYDRSVECHLEALRLWEKLDRQDKIAKAYRGIAGNYHYLGDLSNAEKYYKKCTETAEKANVPGELITGLMGLGVMADLKNEPDKAIGYYNRAMKIAQENDLQNELNAVRVNAGMSYKRLKDYPTAEPVYAGAELFWKAGRLNRIFSVV